jgi:hypothetical protein
MAKMNDPELHAMNTIRGAMEPLDDSQVRRVKLWILDRYGEPGVKEPTAPTLAPPAETSNSGA